MTRTEDRVVVVPCSGIGKPSGSVSREAAYELCENLRPHVTELVALSKLVLGDTTTRKTVARTPCVAIDGCQQMCASKMVKKSGGGAIHAVAVLDAFRRHRELKAEGVAELNDAGRELARVMAQEMADTVDAIVSAKAAKGERLA